MTWPEGNRINALHVTLNIPCTIIVLCARQIDVYIKLIDGLKKKNVLSRYNNNTRLLRKRKCRNSFAFLLFSRHFEKKQRDLFYNGFRLYRDPLASRQTTLVRSDGAADPVGDYAKNRKIYKKTDSRFRFRDNTCI